MLDCQSSNQEQGPFCIKATATYYEQALCILSGACQHLNSSVHWESMLSQSKLYEMLNVPCSSVALLVKNSNLRALEHQAKEMQLPLVINVPMPASLLRLLGCGARFSSSSSSSRSSGSRSVSSGGDRFSQAGCRKLKQPGECCLRTTLS